MFVDWMENFPLEGKKENNEVGKMCRYCDSNILDALAINSKDEAVIINQDTETGEYFIDGLDERVYIDYCPMCRKEAGRVKQILDYGLELENVKKNELPDKDNEIIIQFNNILSEKYGLFEVDVLENDNLYFRGRIISNTKSENNAKLKLLIAELNEFYKKYNLKKVIKSIIAYGHTI